MATLPRYAGQQQQQQQQQKEAYGLAYLSINGRLMKYCAWLVSFW
jgi:hypothetical protein